MTADDSARQLLRIIDRRVRDALPPRLSYPVRGRVVTVEGPRSAWVLFDGSTGPRLVRGVPALPTPLLAGDDVAVERSDDGWELITHILGRDPAPAASGSTDVDVRDFGAVGVGYGETPAGDDAAAFQAAIDAVSASGGGVVRVPNRLFQIGTGLISYKGVLFRGEHSDDGSQSAGTGWTKGALGLTYNHERPLIRWIGPEGGTMYYIRPIFEPVQGVYDPGLPNPTWVGAESYTVEGGGSVGITWDGDYRAGIAVHLDCTRGAQWRGRIMNCREIGLLVSSTHGSWAAGSQFNHFDWIEWSWAVQPPDTSCDDAWGVVFRGNGNHVPSTQQFFNSIVGGYKNGGLLSINQLDNSHFGAVHGFNAGGTGTSIRLGEPATDIISISVANPTVVTSQAPHGLSTGDSLHIQSTNSVPVIDGVWDVTVLSPTTFSVPVNVTTTAGTHGTWGTAWLNVFDYVASPILTMWGTGGNVFRHASEGMSIHNAGGPDIQDNYWHGEVSVDAIGAAAKRYRSHAYAMREWLSLSPGQFVAGTGTTMAAFGAWETITTFPNAVTSSASIIIPAPYQLTSGLIEKIQVLYGNPVATSANSYYLGIDMSTHPLDGSSVGAERTYVSGAPMVAAVPQGGVGYSSRWTCDLKPLSGELVYAQGDTIHLRVYRFGSNGADTSTDDCAFLGVRLGFRAVMPGVHWDIPAWE